MANRLDGRSNALADAVQLGRSRTDCAFARPGALDSRTSPIDGATFVAARFDALSPVVADICLASAAKVD